MMMTLPVQEMGFASWLPTYAIKSGVSTLEHAAVYSSYFWLPNALGRLVWTFLVKCSYTCRLKIIFGSGAIISFLAVILQFLQEYRLICLICPVLFGTMLACVYSFCLALPLERGFKTTTANNAHFMLANCIGDGIVLGPVGYSIKFFGFKSLIVIVFLSYLLSSWSLHKTLDSMDDEPLPSSTKNFLGENMIQLESY
jgi:fucose permease